MSFVPFGPTIGNLAPPLTVANGGTGATTAPGGLANLGGLVNQAATGLAGFALQNGTPAILTWTAPNDGQMHTAWVVGSILVTSATTGGAISISYTDTGSNARTNSLNGGTLGTGLTNLGLTPRMVAPGTTVTVAQSSAMTAGAAVFNGQLWGI